MACWLTERWNPSFVSTKAKVTCRNLFILPSKESLKFQDFRKGGLAPVSIGHQSKHVQQADQMYVAADPHSTKFGTYFCHCWSTKCSCSWGGGKKIQQKETQPWKTGGKALYRKQVFDHNLKKKKKKRWINDNAWWSKHFKENADSRRQTGAKGNRWKLPSVLDHQTPFFTPLPLAEKRKQVQAQEGETSEVLL